MKSALRGYELIRSTRSHTIFLFCVYCSRRVTGDHLYLNTYVDHALDHNKHCSVRLTPGWKEIEL